MFTWETGKRIKKTDLVLKSGQMAMFMKEPGKKMRNTDKVLISLQMEELRFALMNGVGVTNF